MTSVSVIGAGAWGTALAQMYTLSNHHVTLVGAGENPR